MKQTAVEWLCNEWLYIDQEFDMNLIDKKTYWEKLRSIQKQAKAMEKKQIENAFNQGFSTAQWDKSKENKAEQYYTENFKSE